MKISTGKCWGEDAIFCSALAALLGYGAGWLPLAFPLMLFAATLLLVFQARLNEDRAVFSPPGTLPLLLLAGLPLAQLTPLPPPVLKIVCPGTWRLYGETVWLAAPGVWMPVSLQPKATLNAFFFMALNGAVYLLTADLLRERRRLEHAVAALTTFAALAVVVSAALPGYPSPSAVGQAPADSAAGPGGAPGVANLQALLVALFPMLLLFSGYRLSLLRHYTVRERIAEIFSRKSPWLTGPATTTVALALLWVYLPVRSAPAVRATGAAALLLCGLRLFLNRRRRGLGRPAFVAACVFCVAAVLAGEPNVQGKWIDSGRSGRTGAELRWLGEAGAAAKLLADFPVLGTGLGTAPLVRSRLAGAGGDAEERGATAAPADVVVGGGLVGVLLGAWFLVALLRRVAGRRKEPGSRLAACLLAGSFAGLLALAVLSLSGLMPVAGSLCAFLLAGLAVAVTSPPGVERGADDVAAGITRRTPRAGAVLAVLIAGAWGLSALGAWGGKSWYPEAWQPQEGREESNPDPVAAAGRARSAGRLDPLEGRYPFAQARLWLAAGDLPAAGRQLVAALRRDPANGGYLQALGALQARDGSRSQGERLIRAGLRDRSALAERQEFYARWLAASARTEEAMQVMREGLAASPGRTRSFLQMMILEGVPLRELRRALPNRSRCFLDYADYQREAGDPRGAGESYRLALGLAMGETETEPSTFWRLYGYFAAEGEDEAALAALQAGLRLFPAHPSFRRLSAETYERLGLHFRADEEYRRALLTDPDEQKARPGLEALATEQAHDNAHVSPGQ